MVCKSRPRLREVIHHNDAPEAALGLHILLSGFLVGTVGVGGGRGGGVSFRLTHTTSHGGQGESLVPPIQVDASLSAPRIPDLTHGGRTPGASHTSASFSLGLSHTRSRRPPGGARAATFDLRVTQSRCSRRGGPLLLPHSSGGSGDLGGAVAVASSVRWFGSPARTGHGHLLRHSHVVAGGEHERLDVDLRPVDIPILRVQRHGGDVSGGNCTRVET